MSLHTWFLFALAYFLTTLSPGPNVLLVIRNTVRYGHQGTLATVCGNLLSQGIVVVLVALGVGTLLSALPPLFIAIKVAGAAYLIYLGIKQLRGTSVKPTAHVKTDGRMPLNRFKVFKEAVLVSGSNPKTMIFLSAFMPQFINNDHALAGQFALMYLTIAVTVGSVHAIYALGVQRVNRSLGAKAWLAHVKRLSGALFIGMGVKLLSAKV